MQAASLFNTALIRLVTLPKGLYSNMGVDTNHLTTILEMKLALDDRRSKSFMQRNKDKEDNDNASFGGLSFLMFILMGALYLIPLLVIDDKVTGFTLSMGMMMFFLAATLISDFTSVLIDVRDNMILLPRPISDRTFLLGRLLHILIYILKVVIPMSIPTIIAIGIMNGGMGILGYVLTLPFLVLFTIFAVNAIYLLILRLTTPEKFKSIITSVQVAFAVIVYAAYQVLPRIMNKVILESYSLEGKTWPLFVPTYWFASLWQLLSTGKGSASQITVAIIALLLPVALIWVVVKVFAPSFNRKLGLISGSEGGAVPSSTNVQKRSLSARFSPILSRSQAEQMGFEFTWNLTGRQRDFRLKTYPAFGYLLVLVVVFFIPRKGISMDQMINSLKTERFILLSMLYLSSFFLMTALSTSRYTEKPGAAWIFDAAPLTRPGEILAGSLRALLMKFFIPLMILMSFIVLAIVGWKALPDVLLAFSGQLLLIYLTAYFSAMELPFSLPMSDMQKGRGFLKTLLVLFLMTLVIGAHYAMKFLPAGTWVMIPVTMLCVFLIDRSIYRSGWQQLSH